MTTQSQRVTAPTRLQQICYSRLTSPNFATHQSTLAKLINWIKGGAK